MALAARIRSGLPLLSKAVHSAPIPAPRSALALSYSEVPLALFGGSGNYASALYLAGVKQNCLDKVEAELLDLVEAIKKSPTFSQFTSRSLQIPE